MGVSHRNITFRIVAGSLKGQQIVVPDLGVTRPPLTRVRKAIFDFLTPYLAEARYLDLFSGTGSYLFEAVSRGAASVVGVECERKLVEAILAESARLSVTDRMQCRCDDVFAAIKQLQVEAQQFDIIMLAPPQYRGLVDRTLTALAAGKILADGGIILCQHDTSETAKLAFPGFGRLQRRKYGNTTFTILVHSPEG